MAIFRLIQEWRSGCEAVKDRPADCIPCTERLIDTIEMHETVSRFSGCITPKFYMVVDRLRESVTFAAQISAELL